MAKKRGTISSGGFDASETTHKGGRAIEHETTTFSDEQIREQRIRGIAFFYRQSELTSAVESVSKGFLTKARDQYGEFRKENPNYDPAQFRERLKYAAISAGIRNPEDVLPALLGNPPKSLEQTVVFDKKEIQDQGQ